MSRSYKKVPVLKDNGKGSKKAKKLANKKIRRIDIGNGGAYKKAYPQYDIHDFVSYWSKEDALKSFHDPNSRMYHYKETEEQFLNWWAKNNLRK